jgi:hypothetical protein
MRALVAVISMCASAAAASAQSFSASGQVGYLQEWELKASLARTVSAGKVEYSGPLTLRHVGLCSANGVEEKSGELRLAVSRWTGGIEGTLAMDGDSCRVATRRACRSIFPSNRWAWAPRARRERENNAGDARRPKPPHLGGQGMTLRALAPPCAPAAGEYWRYFGGKVTGGPYPPGAGAYPPGGPYAAGGGP